MEISDNIKKLKEKRKQRKELNLLLEKAHAMLKLTLLKK